MMGGLQWMPMWLVDSLGILVLVCKENKIGHKLMLMMMASYLSVQIQLLILVHTLDKTVLSS